MRGAASDEVEVGQSALGRGAEGDARLLKVLIVGDSGVGKSCLLRRYVANRFDVANAQTVGVVCDVKEVTLGTVTYRLQMWDTAGQERFRSLRTPFYRGVDICFLVFSVKRRSSFDNLQFWLDEVAYYAELETPTRFPFVIIGNKADETENPAQDPRDVLELEASDWACGRGPFPYLETSALDNINVKVAFETAVRSWQNLNEKKLLDDKNILKNAHRSQLIKLKPGATGSAGGIGTARSRNAADCCPL